MRFKFVTSDLSILLNPLPDHWSCYLFGAIKMTDLVDRKSEGRSPRGFMPQKVYLPGISNKANIHFPINKSLFKSDSPKKKAENRPNPEDNERPRPSKMNRAYFSYEKIDKPKSKVLSSQPPILSFAQTEKSKATNQSAKNFMNKSAVYFTKRKQDEFAQTMRELERQRIERHEKSMEKKQDFEDFKEKKRQIKEVEKNDFFDHLYFQKMERDRDLQIKEQTRKEEKDFLHEARLEKFDMIRRSHLQTKHEDIFRSKEIYMETQKNSHFLKMEKLKAKRNHDKLLESRLVFLMEGKVGEDTEKFLDRRMTSRHFAKEQNAGEPTLFQESSIEVQKKEGNSESDV